MQTRSSKLKGLSPKSSRPPDETGEMKTLANNHLNFENSECTQPPRQSQRIQDKCNRAQNELDTHDPVNLLPVELLAKIYQYCSNSDLCRLRLVSKDWKSSVDDSWKKRVIICVHHGERVGCKGTTTFLEFKKEIEQPSFCYAKFPFRRIKLEKFAFVYEQYKQKSVMGKFADFIAPTTSYLGLSDCSFESLAEFLRLFLRKFENLKILVLTRPTYMKANIPNTGTTLKQHECQSKLGQDLPLFANLIHLKIDFSDFQKVHFQLPWATFLSCTPHLERLEICVWKETVHDTNWSIEIIDLLRPLEELSLQNKLKKLKHIYIFFIMSVVTEQTHGQFCSAIKNQVDSLKRSALQLDSLRFEIVAKYIDPRLVHNTVFENTAEEYIGSIIGRFGEGVRHMDLCFWKAGCIHFPPLPVTNIRMERLEHLSLPLGLGKRIKSAENMPNLRSLEIMYKPRHMRSKIYLSRPLTNQRYPTDEELLEDNAVQQNDDDADDPDYKIGDIVPLYVYSGKRDLQLKYSDRREDVDNASAIEFLQCANPEILGLPVFQLLTHFRCEEDTLVNIYALPKWMPNLSSLEMPLDPKGFTIVCDKLRQLQRLTITRNMDRNSLSGPPFIDDCAITGRRHNSRVIFLCSCNEFVAREKRQKSVNWNYFKRLGKPALNPNITYLQDLRFFKIEEHEDQTVFHDSTRQAFFLSTSTFRVVNTCLTDASVFDGFYKLPRLHFLQINARLSEQTTRELFRRIPQCVLRWTSKQKTINSRLIYNVRQNFERDNIA